MKTFPEISKLSSLLSHMDLMFENRRIRNIDKENDDNIVLIDNKGNRTIHKKDSIKYTDFKPIK